MTLPSHRLSSRKSDAPGSTDDVVRALARFYRPPKTSWLLALNSRSPVGGVARGDEIPGWAEDNLRLQTGLIRLSLRDRLLLFLSYAEGWPVERIAERLEISPAQCRKIRDRALAQLAAVDWPPPNHGTSTVSTPDPASAHAPPSRTP
jgi:sigma-70-like protein